MKKRIILILLTFLLVFLVGCSRVATNDVITKSQEIANNWVTTKDYECPDGYQVKVGNNKNNQIVVVKDEISITYNICEDSVELDSMTADYTNPIMTLLLVMLLLDIILLGLYSVFG